jgi:hypothetical protein
VCALLNKVALTDMTSPKCAGAAYEEALQVRINYINNSMRINYIIKLWRHIFFCGIFPPKDSAFLHPFVYTNIGYLYPSYIFPSSFTLLPSSFFFLQPFHGWFARKIVGTAMGYTPARDALYEKLGYV